MKNIRRERFIGELATGQSAAGAARRAGYSEHYAKRAAHNLAKAPEVQSAVAEIPAKVREDAELTAEKYMAMLMEALGEAKSAKQYTAAAKLPSTIGKLGGLLTDRLAVLHGQVDLAGRLKPHRRTSMVRWWT